MLGNFGAGGPVPTNWWGGVCTPGKRGFGDVDIERLGTGDALDIKGELRPGVDADNMGEALETTEGLCDVGRKVGRSG